MNKKIKTHIFIVLLSFGATGFCLAQKNSEKGDRYFDQNLFATAATYYQMDIHSKDKKTSEYALQKLANCYRISGEFEMAEETFKKILRKKKKEPLNYLNYGLALKNSAKYAEAKVQLDEYIKLKPEDPMGMVFWLSCDSAQKWLDETIGKEVKNLENINTEFSEFSPVLMATGKLYFSSSREGSKKALVSFDGGGDIHRLDLYTITVDDIEKKNTKKTNIVNFKEINTPLHEGSACFSTDGKELYFTKTIKGKRDKETNEILGTLQVFYSVKDSSGKWSLPKSAFAFNSSDYSVGQPSLSKDGQTIYFMSDKPGGFGKTDIYYAAKTADGKWGMPVNAGNLVNTFGHELFPTISNSGVLYFSSNSHPGMGQLDIFKASLENGKWTNVENLKPPINSIANDFGITFDGDYPRGFFSSDRFNGKGNEDIYSFSEEIPLELNFKNDTLSFKDASVFDDIKYKLVNETDSTESKLKADSGVYALKLHANVNYKLVAQKNGLVYTTVYLHFQKDSLKKNCRLQLKTSNRPVHVRGRVMTGLTGEVKEDKVTRFDNFVEPDSQLVVPSE